MRAMICIFTCKVVYLSTYVVKLNLIIWMLRVTGCACTGGDVTTEREGARDRLLACPSRFRFTRNMDIQAIAGLLKHERENETKSG